MKLTQSLIGKIKITPNKIHKAAPPRVELIPQAQVCEDCCVTVVDRHIDYRFRKKPYRHWSSYCRSCSKYKNPESGKFDMESAVFKKYWYEHRNDK